MTVSGEKNLTASPATEAILRVSHLSKTYASGHNALRDITLEIHRGEIFGLLGPNGAGKTTLINILCGIVNPSAGIASVDGHDIVKDYRRARAKIGLVPQEITVHAFESVWDTVRFTQGLFGKPYDPTLIEKILKDLSLWEKRESKLITLSGGMKRRVMIAKALSHQPRILFLDEPSAGVDVKLRHDMWNLVRGLRDDGVTIILTTHYLEEAEEIAERIGVIDHGELILVENKVTLMKKMGTRQLVLYLKDPLPALPADLSGALSLSADGTQLVYNFDLREETGIPELLKKLDQRGIGFKNLQTSETSLEDIFVSLVEGR